MIKSHRVFNSVLFIRKKAFELLIQKMASYCLARFPNSVFFNSGFNLCLIFFILNNRFASKKMNTFEEKPL